MAATAEAGIGTDFNGDGKADVAIGVPWDTLGNGQRGGTVVVMYGSASGLTSFGSQQWSQNTPLVDGQAEDADQFGSALAVGDFNADGFSDLAIAAPGEDVGGIEDAGVVHVLYGSSSGLRATGSQMWALDTPGVPGVAGDHPRFGNVMAAGNVGRAGYDDLVISDDGELDAGAVTVLYGGATGVSTAGVQRWTQGSRRCGRRSRGERLLRSVTRRRELRCRQERRPRDRRARGDRAPRRVGRPLLLEPCTC